MISLAIKVAVVIEGDGCAEVEFSQNDRRATDDAFWDLLAEAVDVRKAEIHYLLPDELRR